jgi:beta-phosphoglucomutase-like phosphatase (HAD superfamily)
MLDASGPIRLSPPRNQPLPPHDALSSCPLAYRALIFDCDGVLIDSEWLHAETWCETLTREGVAITTDEFARFRGITSPQMMRILETEGRLPDGTDHRALITARREAYWERLETDLREVTGAVDFLKAFAPRVALALATSNLRSTIRRIVRIMEWETTFATTVGLDDVEHPKPAPDIFQCAVERLGLPHGQCLVFEDSVPGVQAAHAAGVDVVGVLTDQTAEALLSQGACAVIRDFNDTEGLAAALGKSRV